MKTFKFVPLLAIGCLVPTAALAATSPCAALNSTADSSYLGAVATKGACNQIITIAADGSVSIAAANPFPYEGSEDQYIGVINNSATALSSLTLSGPADLFGFENDGIDLYGIPGNSKDTSNIPDGGYGGPNAFFTAINSNDSTGTVNFINAIAGNGGTGYFSLELSPSQGGFTVTGTGGGGVTPEPGSLVLLGTGVAGLVGTLRRRLFA